jgi:hypothetical protein
MITEKEIIAMKEYYSAKRRALAWYELAMNSVNDELMLSCLFRWQECCDEAAEWWKKVKPENQVRLTFISIGHQI